MDKSSPSWLRRAVVTSKLHSPLLKVRAQRDILALHLMKDNRPTQAYCLSPYKSGTTYLSSSFAGKVAHEPIHYATLQRLSDTDFLALRHQKLGLSLESSGFLAGRLKQLRTFAPDTPVLYLVRPPSIWAESVIRYFNQLGSRVNSNFVLRDYFDHVTSIPLDAWPELAFNDRTIALTKLVDFWFTVYEEGLEDDHAKYVMLDDLDRRREEVATFLSLDSTPVRSAWRRTGSSPMRVAVQDYLDISAYEARWRLIHDRAQSY